MNSFKDFSNIKIDQDLECNVTERLSQIYFDTNNKKSCLTKNILSHGYYGENGVDGYKKILEHEFQIIDIVTSLSERRNVFVTDLPVFKLYNGNHYSIECEFFDTLDELKAFLKSKLNDDLFCVYTFYFINEKWLLKYCNSFKKDVGFFKAILMSTWT